MDSSMWLEDARLSAIEGSALLVLSVEWGRINIFQLSPRKYLYSDPFNGSGMASNGQRQALGLSLYFIESSVYLLLAHHLVASSERLPWFSCQEALGPRS